MNSQLWWYTARASGLVAWALLALSVLWGLAMSTKALGPKARPATAFGPRRPATAFGPRRPATAFGPRRPAWLLDLHRFLGGTALVFVGLHVGSILLDSYVHFGLVEVLVPLTGTWHPMAVAWGIAGLYLMLAVELTSLLRSHLSPRAWRMTHYLSFPLFASATAHALSAGTDRRLMVVRLAMYSVTALVAILTVMRARAEMASAQARLATQVATPTSVPAASRRSDFARTA